VIRHKHTWYTLTSLITFQTLSFVSVDSELVTVRAMSPLTAGVTPIISPFFALSANCTLG